MTRVTIIPANGGPKRQAIIPDGMGFDDQLAAMLGLRDGDTVELKADLDGVQSGPLRPDRIVHSYGVGGVKVPVGFDPTQFDPRLLRRVKVR